LTVSTNEIINVSDYGYNCKITINSNTNWNAASNQMWCVLSDASCNDNDGEMNEYILVANVQKNTETSERTAIISVTGTDVNSQTITITQMQAPAFINITKPTNGTVVQAGSELHIEWESDGVTGTIIKLRNYETTILELDNNAPANGSGTWTIPANTYSGDHYCIYIQSKNNTAGDVSEYFTITN